MKILQLHNEYRVHGGENVVLERDRADLEAAGHQVFSHGVTNEGSTAETLGALALAPWNRREAKKVERIVEANQPDVVHVHNTWFRLSPATIVAVSKMGVPIVHTLHNFRWLCANGEMIRNGVTCRDCVSSSRFSAVKHRCYRDSLPLSIVAATTGAVAERSGAWSKHIDRFIALTPRARELFSTWGFAKDRIVVRPHRISDPGSRSAQPSRSNTVLYAGRVSEAKGVDELCRVWTSQPRAHKLVVVGDGPIAADLASAFPDVEFVGHVEIDEVTARMRQSRALILPTLGEEAFPLVVVEAMACGIPVALSDMTLVRDYVEQVGPDWTFDVQRQAEWERVLSLIADDNSVDVGGTRARQVYEDNFADDGARSLVAIYEEAIEHRKAGVGSRPQ